MVLVIPTDIGGGGVSVNVNDTPPATFKTTQQGLTNVRAALPAAPLAARKTITVENQGPGACYLGDVTVTSANGVLLDVGQTYTSDITAALLLYGVTNGADLADVRILEVA